MRWGGGGGEDKDLHNNDHYQPRLLDQYSHLFRRRQGPLGGQRTVSAYGTIKRLITDRGFGFIRPDGHSQDLFFHRSSVEDANFDELKEGDSVEFQVERDHLHNENQAVKVRLAQRPPENQTKKSTPRRGSGRYEYRSVEYRSLIGTSRANYRK